MASDLPLGSEFPPARREDWLKLVREALKDQPYERLVSRTYDGLAIEPLYPRAANARPITGRSGPWRVMARVDHPDPAAANAEALHELQNGATGLALVFVGAPNACGYGLPGDEASVARVLESVALEAVAIELHTAEPSREAADHVAALCRRRGHRPETLAIHFGHDAIGAHTLTGTLPLRFADLMPRFAAHVGALAWLGFKGPLAAADGRIVQAAGGSEAQELAYTLAVAVAYLRALEAEGFALADARRMIGFRLAADTDQLLTMAKFRALRKLWARVEQACGLEPRPCLVSAETAWPMMTRRDPHVNILRATVAALSAAVAGADAITVLPHTAALGLPDRSARRIARNVQLLLLEESNLARVTDPAAGSGAIEDLTDKLCTAAWSLFQEIERAGGAPAALERGLLQEKIAATRAAREAAVATRNAPLTGTTDFPDLAETPPAVVEATPVAVASPVANFTYPALRPMRLAEPFEALRDASDRALAETGARPKVFLANLGKVAEFNARATFAKNFFEAGGIEAVTNDGFASCEELLAAFRSSGATLACLCGADARYETDGAGVAAALTNAGARHLYAAGRPQPALQSAGVGTFIHAGCDALATLRRAHDILGLRD